VRIVRRDDTISEAAASEIRIEHLPGVHRGWYGEVVYDRRGERSGVPWSGKIAANLAVG